MAVHSTFFRETFEKSTKEDPVSTITLEDINPVHFGFFLYFLYRGGYHNHKDKQASAASELITPSIQAYMLGDKLGAPSFMNNVMSHIYYDIGKLFSITPELMEWTQKNTTPTSKLRALFVDMLTTCWGKDVRMVKQGKEADEQWSRLFDDHPDLRKDFIFGLKGDARVKRLEEYCVATQEQVSPPKTVHFIED